MVVARSVLPTRARDRARAAGSAAGISRMPGLIEAEMQVAMSSAWVTRIDQIDQIDKTILVGENG